MLRKISFLSFEIICLIYLVLSSYSWFGVMIPGSIVPVMSCAIMMLCLFLMNVKFKVQSQVVLQCLLLVSIFFVFSVNRNFQFGFNQFIKFMPAIFIFILPSDLKRQVLKFVTKWFSIMVGISLLIFLVLQVVNISSPLPPIPGHKIAGSGEYPYFYNYILYLKPSVDYAFKVRFQGFFLEPGHLAINCIMFLYGNNYDFKNRYLWVLTAVVFISLSLAGYVLFILGWLILKVKDFSTVAYTVLGGLAFIIALQFWSGGDNPLNDQIMSRLEVDTHKGIKGNNRTSPRTDNMYALTIDSDQVFFGMDNADAKKPFGAGYKKFIILYGIVPILVVMAYYWSLSSRRTRPRYAYGFLLLIFLTFLDCEYFHWFSWLFCYTCGCGIQLRKIGGKEGVRYDDQSDALPFVEQEN